MATSDPYSDVNSGGYTYWKIWTNLMTLLQRYFVFCCFCGLQQRLTMAKKLKFTCSHHQQRLYTNTLLFILVDILILQQRLIFKWIRAIRSVVYLITLIQMISLFISIWLNCCNFLRWFETFANWTNFTILGAIYLCLLIFYLWRCDSGPAPPQSTIL